MIGVNGISWWVLIGLVRCYRRVLEPESYLDEPSFGRSYVRVVIWMDAILLLSPFNGAEERQVGLHYILHLSICLSGSYCTKVVSCNEYKMNSSDKAQSIAGF